MPDPVHNEIVEIKYKMDIKERAEDVVLRAFMEGEEFLVLEIQVVGTLDESKDKDPLTIEYLAVCNTKVLMTSWMQDKNGKLTTICKKTVMNLKPQRIAGLIPFIKMHDKREVCLYRLSAWVFMDEDGTKKWNIKDKIDPALIEVDALALQKAESAREWAKEVLVESPVELD
ncbi:MAG: hypothetical protein Q7U51_05085 [Methanoregula sp.]|nr:hypothetical protein [Methanoregula sp.]